MLTRIKQWLEPPYFAGDEEKTSQARLMDTLGQYLALALVIAAFFLVPFFVAQKVATWAVIAALLILWVTCRRLLFQGRVELAGILLGASVWTIFEGMSIVTRGITSPMLFAVAATAINITLLFKARIGNLFVVVSILTGLVVALFQQSGFFAPGLFTFTPMATWFLFALALVFMNRTMNLVVRKLESALMLAHQQNAARQTAEENLRASEERFRAVVEHSYDGMLFLNAEYKIAYATRSYARIIGHTPNELVGRDAIEYIHPDDQKAVARKIQELLQQADGVASIECRLQHKNGHWVWVETTATNFLAEPNVQAIVLNSRDITERKRSEERVSRISECFLNFGSDPRENINRLTALCGDLLAADCALYNRLDQGLLCSWGQWHIPPNYNPIDQPEGHLCYDVIRFAQDQVFVVRNLPDTPYAQTDPNVLPYKLQTYVGRAVKLGDETVGSLCVVYQRDIAPSEEDKQIMGVIASAIAVEERRKSAESAMHTSEEKLRAFFEQVAEGITLIDEKGIITEWNPAAERLSGLERRRVIGTPIWEMMSHVMPSQAQTSETTQAMAAGIRAALATGKSPLFNHPIETTMRRPDGELSYSEQTIFPIKTENGYWLGATNRDITGRKRAEQALRASEEKYREIFEHSLEGIYQTTPEGRYLSINPAFARMFGYASIEEMMSSINDIGRQVYVNPEDRNKLKRIFADQGQVEQFEVEVYRKDGSKIWISINAHVVHKPDGSFFYEGTNEDITKRKCAEEALRINEARYRSLVETQTDAIARSDVNGCLTFVNDAYCQIFGRSREELLGHDFFQTVFPDDLAITLASQQTIQTPPYRSRMENRHMTPSGIRWFSWDNAAVVDDAGNVLEIQGVGRDITENRQREHELQAIATVSSALRVAPTRAEMLPVIVEQLATLLHCEMLSIEITDPATGNATIEAAHGAWKSIVGNRQSAGTGLNAIVTKTRQPFLDNRIRENPDLFVPNYLAESISALAGVPMIAQDHLIGFLWMGRKTDITESEVRLLSAVADIAANAIHRATLHEQTQKDAAELALAYDTTLEGWARALELRDQETEGHARRVVEMTIELAQAMGICNGELENVRRGALLHDIGKMGIPDSILLKPGTLNEREWEIMRRHPEYAHNLLAPIEYLRPTIDIPYCHHEKWDSTGYPRGLIGETIPLAARIFAIVDVWDALRSDRPYRKAWSFEQARKYIQEQAGKHFDPQVAATFLEMLMRQSRWH